jgi:hypothetical protein
MRAAICRLDYAVFEVTFMQIKEVVQIFGEEAWARNFVR